MPQWLHARKPLDCNEADGCAAPSMIIFGPKRSAFGLGCLARIPVVFEKQNSAPGDFVRLAMEGGRGGYSSYGAFELALQKTLGCDLDYVRRLLNGTRQLRENHRRTICELLGLNQIDFGVSLREFAVQLGLPRQKATALSAKGSGGIDFASRTADRYSVQQLFELIRGYWETYQWSVSKLGEQSVSRELCIVEEPDANNFIQCRLIDVNFSYAGVIFPCCNTSIS